MYVFDVSSKQKKTQKQTKQRENFTYNNQINLNKNTSVEKHVLLPESVLVFKTRGLTN